MKKKKMRKNQEHNATMSKQLSGFLKRKFHETNLIAFFNRIKKKNLYNISGWRKWNGCIQKSHLKNEFIWAGCEVCLRDWNPAGRPREQPVGSRGLAGGWWPVACFWQALRWGRYLQSIIINDLREVTSRTLIKCAHVAKWEIGGENTREAGA